ncbi:MAG TPA: ATP-binding cassette domain-containing protein [Vicinamibacterales bacterium]|nr:ATP-binding cassette domain-containing protein [Vicinamibacterales bacterium]
MSVNTITLDRVSAGYGLGRVVSDVSFTIAAGEAATILGRNGVGKTTLLRTLVGLHPAAGGRVLFDEEDVTRHRAFDRARRGIGYVPQGRGIFQHLTVAQNLELGLTACAGRPGPRRRGIPDHIFDVFPVLDRLRHRKAGLLSGGEAQQLSIGRALVTEPTILILDEPTEGIQPSVVQQIQAALVDIRREWHVAVLLVEQYLDFAWSVADRFYVLRGGRIAGQGRTSEQRPETVAHLLNV